MKKVLSIVFALLILFSGLHLSIATHYCGGEIAAVKWSFTGEKATCGMERTSSTCPIHDVVSTNCCQDEMSFYRTDTNDGPSFFQINKVSTPLLQVFNIPVSLSIHSFNLSRLLCTHISPRDKLQLSSVSLEDICVFRI